MTRPAIKLLALSKLDELETHTGASQSPADELLEKLMDGSVENMLRNAPIHLLPPIKVNVASVSFVHEKDLANGTGYIALPADFIRLSSFKMAAWQRPVVDVISMTNPLFDMQKNRATRGGVNKPVVVIRYIDTGAGEEVSADITEEPAVE